MIKIDQNAVDEVLAGFQAWARKQAEIMEETGQSSVRYTGTKRRPAELERLIRGGHLKRGRYYDNLRLTTPWGEKRVVHVNIEPGNVPICCAGSSMRKSRKKRSNVVFVYFPSTMPPEALSTDRVAFQIRNALLHELTHSVDWLGTVEDETTKFIRKNLRGIDPKRARKIANDLGEDFAQVLVERPGGFMDVSGLDKAKVGRLRNAWLGRRAREQTIESYYNQPHEVRAFMRMIYEEVRPYVAMLEKRFPGRTLGDHLAMALELSETWNWDITKGAAHRDIKFPEPIRERLMMSQDRSRSYHEYLTPKNRDYIVKKLYQALSRGDARI